MGGLCPGPAIVALGGGMPSPALVAWLAAGRHMAIPFQRNLNVCSSCTGVPVHTRLLPLPCLATLPFAAQLIRTGRRMRQVCTGTLVHFDQPVRAAKGTPC